MVVARTYTFAIDPKTGSVQITRTTKRLMDTT